MRKFEEKLHAEEKHVQFLEAEVCARPMLAGHDVRSLDLEIYQKTIRNVYAEVKPRALMNTELYVRPLNYHVANSVQSELWVRLDINILEFQWALTRNCICFRYTVRSWQSSANRI